MMQALAVCLLAAGWLFLHPSRFPDPSVFYLCVAGAFAAFAFARQRPAPIIPRGWSSLPAAVALIVMYLVWGNHSGFGALALAIGILLASAIGRGAVSQRFTDGLVSVGTVLLFQLGGSYLYYFVVGPRAHSADPFAQVLHAVLNLIGVPSGVTTAGIQLVFPDLLYQVAPSLNNMGLYFFLQVFIGVLALIGLGRMRIGAWWRAAVILFFYMLIRYAALMAYDISRNSQGTYWWPSITAWTSVWVFLFLRGAAFAPRPRPTNQSFEPAIDLGSWRKAALVVGCTALGIASWTLVQGYVDPGTKKQGRLLIDEQHSDWEWSDKKFDTLWYGQQSTYNFYSGAEFLGKHYQLDRGYSEFTPEFLAKYDVILLKTPTRSYSPPEVAAVREWVKNGGGLVLIGDHTNVFGHATFLNQIVGEFGLRVYPDIAYEAVTGDLNVYMMPHTLRHPVTQNLPLFFWGGQCTLRGDLGARGVMVDLNVKTLPADYSERNFFPERTAHADYRYGPFFTVACATYGNGRIIIFTDSTLISNFFIFIPGKPELMLAMVDFANREERFPGWRKFMLIIGGFALVVALLSARSFGARGATWMLAAGFGTFLIVAPAIEKANRKNYPLPEPLKPYKQLIFEGEYSRYFIPELRLANNEDKDLHTFFVWTQRVDVFPRKYYTFDKCLAEARKMGALIMIDPARAPTPQQTEQLKSYVSDGGTFILIDDPENGPRPTNEILAPFALSMDFAHPISPSALAPELAAASPLWIGAAPIVGGQPLYSAPSGTPVAGVANYGRGRVIVYGNSRTFERKIMGYTAMVPNPQQAAISRFVYQLMDWIFNPTGAVAAPPEPPATQKTEPAD